MFLRGTFTYDKVLSETPTFFSRFEIDDVIGDQTLRALAEHESMDDGNIADSISLHWMSVVDRMIAPKKFPQSSVPVNDNDSSALNPP